MTVDQVLELVGPVRKSGRGWMAKCPGHHDNSPSLSIREAENRILLHCFTGCSVGNVCAALGIGIRDLFVRNLSQAEWSQLQKSRHERKQADRKQQIEFGRVTDACREVEALLEACHCHDISQWNIEKFDRVMNAVGQALELLRDEDEDYFYEHIGRTAPRI